MNPVINFCLKLFVALAIVFGIHIAILHYIEAPLFDNYIIACYAVNYLLAVVIYSALYFLRKKYLDVLGFIFMAGSFLKFGVFLIFFYPKYMSDGELLRLETTSFLIPYLACLIIETYYLVQLLNKEG